MKYCPKCKCEYEDWPEICADCKVPLVNELPKEDVSKQTPEEQEIRLCHECGYPVSEAEEICKNCGVHLGRYDFYRENRGQPFRF